MVTNQILTAGAVVCRKKTNGEYVWLLVKLSEEEGWEIPKVAVRRGESSVRASIRMMGEQGGMNARVIEEAGRFQSTAVVNGRTIPKRLLYYLMIEKSGGEIVGFKEYQWLDYAKAQKKLGSKREKDVLKEAKALLKEWLKKKKTSA